MIRLTELALKRPLITVLLTLLLVGVGVRAFLQLPIDAFPDVSAPQVKVILKAPGMTPEEMEARVTVPLEQELLGIPQQVMLRSISKYGLSDLTLDFADGTDIYWARQQVAERLSQVQDQLPTGIEGGLAPITTPLGEMFMFTVEGPQSLMERRAVLDWVIRPALRTVPGVADINVLGGLAQTVEVAPDPLRLSAAGVGLNTLQEALLRNHLNTGAGRLADGEETLLVRLQGRLNDLDDVANLVIQSGPSGPVRVRDVATVRVGALTRQGGVTHNGTGETVQGLVLGLRGANARTVVSGIKARLAEVTPQLPEGMTINVVYDRSQLINRAVTTVSQALIEAVVLVLILLFLFLGNLRAALTVAVVLPLSALWTFWLMGQAHLTANLMSLGGLAIAIGMLVDAAVVVVEHIEEERQRHPGRPIIDVVLDSVRAVAVPVGAGILIIAVVFLPLLSLEGLEGKLFKPVALTIIIALLGSLLLSLTVIPLLATLLLRQGTHHEPALPRWLLRHYRPLLARALARPRPILLTALLLFAGSVGVYTQLGKTFMPTLDEGDVIVQLEKLPSISLDESLAIDTRFQQAVMAQVPDVDSITARAGSDEIGLDPMGLNQTDSFIHLKPQKDWVEASKADIIAAIRRVLDDFPGIQFTFTQPIEMRVSEMIIGVRGDVAIRLFGPDLNVLNQTAGEIAAVLEQIPGAEDVSYIANEGVQYLQIRPDQERLARVGLTVEDLTELLRITVEGRVVGIMQQDDRRIPLLLRSEGGLATAERLAQLPLTLPSGEQITLENVATVTRVQGPIQVVRQQGQRYQVVLSNVTGRDLVGFVAEAQAAVAREVILPPGYRLTWGGEFENQQRAAARLSWVVPLALVIILLILTITFNSLRQGLLVLANIPLAMIGGILALAASGEYLSVPASVGFIALLGIAVLNGVVLVHTFNGLHAGGMSLAEAVRLGAERRLRPVMLTATMTALALVPLLFATGPGSEIQRPLAIVVIGGLLSSTLLTLVLLPALYQRYGHGRHTR